MTYGRYRNDVATLYDVFCELVAPKPGEKRASLRFQYPDDFHDPAIVKSVQQFAFPCQLRDVEVDAVQLFSFVLTDSNSKFSFGFCRYTPRTDTCICFLRSLMTTRGKLSTRNSDLCDYSCNFCVFSGFFWPNVFFKALNDISLVIGAAQKEDVESVLTKFYHTDIPNIDEYLRFADHNQKHNYRIVFAEKIPDPTRLPTLSSDKYFLEFYNAIDPRQMLAIFASLLKERRILFTGRKIGTLSSCLHAVSMLLYPMCWQSVFITILPESLVDMVMAPMPYLIGVPKVVLENAKIRLQDLGDVVIVDIDEKTLTSPYDDVAAMPSEVVNYLKAQLRSQSAMDDTFAKNFLRAMVLLFGDYASGFVGETHDTLVFSKERFVSQQRPSYQAYLDSLLGTDGVQYLERFIHDRLELFKEGHVPGDQFEIEIEQMDLKNRPVKENASDVIGALKTSGIQIANRLQRLTPREIRKAASKKKTQNGSEQTPMSFDNLQWESARGDEYDDSPIEVCRDNVPVANLIDFDEPSTSSSLGLSSADEQYLLRPAELSTSGVTPPRGLENVFADPFATSPEGPAPPLPSRPPPPLHPRSIPGPSIQPFPPSGSSAPHLLQFQQGHQWTQINPIGSVPPALNPSVPDWYAAPPLPPRRPASVGPSPGQPSTATSFVAPPPPPRHRWETFE
uniref:UDENN domain-containing protein n=1 Tax=Caenorhabditis tropicalis TaxID=1561998 RepID=A0A1I7U0V6_9PELO